MAAMTLVELAKLVDGRLIGDAQLQINAALPLHDAVEGCITLIDHERHAAALAGSCATAAIVPLQFPDCQHAVIAVPNPHAAFEKIILPLRPPMVDMRAGVHASASVHPTAKLGAGVIVHPGSTIGAHCTIGSNTTIYAGVHVMPNCHIGSDCQLYPSVTLYNDTRVGDRVILHAGSVIGAFGFGYRMSGGKHNRTGQLGWVELGDDVEIGAGTTIDRGTYGPTVIGEGTKIDNQVMIGHNCHIGKHNLLCAQVGIAGSSSTGDYVVMGGQVGIKDHVKIGNRVVIAAKSGIICDIPDGETWQGSPGGPQKIMMQQVALGRRLPEMRNQLRQLEQETAKLRAALETSTMPKAAEPSARKSMPEDSDGIFQSPELPRSTAQVDSRSSDSSVSFDQRAA